MAFIATGMGHHEIAFSDDDRYAFVSNRDDGTVTIVDVQSLEKVKELKTGEVPISLAFSPLGKALYESGGQLSHVYFPTTSIVSLLFVMEDGASAEIAVVGNEGTG